jgi:hypothetical protein
VLGYLLDVLDVLDMLNGVRRPLLLLPRLSNNIVRLGLGLGLGVELGLRLHLVCLLQASIAPSAAAQPRCAAADSYENPQAAKGQK